MPQEYDELDRLILDFEDSDPVGRVKQAMLSGDRAEAGRLIDNLTADQLEKLAAEIPGLDQAEQNTSTEEKSTPDSSGTDPKSDTESVDEGEEEAEKTMGKEKVKSDDHRSGTGNKTSKTAQAMEGETKTKKDEKTEDEKGDKGETKGSDNAKPKKKDKDGEEKEAQESNKAEQAGQVSSDEQNTSTEEKTVDEEKERARANEENGAKEAGYYLRQGTRDALEKIARASLKVAGVKKSSKSYNKKLERKLEQLTDMLLNS